jgi:hypothetical protein
LPPGDNPSANAWPDVEHQAIAAAINGRDEVARPLQYVGELRSSFDIYLNVAERAVIHEKAIATRLPMSAFIRRAALGLRCSPVPAINAEQWAKLGPLAANLNQIAKNLNEGDIFTVSDMITLNELQALLTDIRLALTGKEPDDCEDC